MNTNNNGLRHLLRHISYDNDHHYSFKKLPVEVCSDESTQPHETWWKYVWFALDLPRDHCKCTFSVHVPSIYQEKLHKQHNTFFFL